MRGIRRVIAKTGVFSGFSAIFGRSVVTLHQEMSGITQSVAGEKEPLELNITGGSLSLTHDNL
jgi:hypothetical protein